MRRTIEYILTAVGAILLALFIRHFVLTAYQVPTISMAPSLKPGDFIFADRMAYSKWWADSSPQRGDIVVFRYPSDAKTVFVKRIVGLPGDHIEFDEGRLKINQMAVEYSDSSNDVISDLPGSQYLNVLSEKFGASSHLVMFNDTSQVSEDQIYQVPAGQYFLLGDNRDASDDSRERGTISADNIEGRVVFIWLSLDHREKWLQSRVPKVRWERTFSFVD